jgi:hypothetical protein
MRSIRFVVRLLLVALLVAGAAALYNRFFSAPQETAPQPMVTHHTVLTQVTRMGKLELVKYNFRDIVEYEKDRTDSKFFNQYLDKAKAVLIVNGEAVGCLDLTKIEADDVVEGDSTVIVYLPEPELCVYKINHEQSRLYDTQNTYFQEEGKLVNEAYAAAEKKVRQSALDMGILEQAEENARQILQPFLEQVSGKKVILRKRRQGDFRELDQ